ncbi:MAG TPA: hypothetical protein VJQ44_13850 [Gemmatimonadales bacterium]|nr:hypothetical protein [Gemmatimonadales bacterium]
MAKNLGREFATMDEEERRRFALERKDDNEQTPEELDLNEPRGDDQEEPPRPREG